MPLEQLTAREQDVAALVAQGLTNAAIAYALGISGNTVKIHLKSIFLKLGVQSRVEVAVLWAQTAIESEGGS